MAIYAIGDLHLAHNQLKPMDVFGDRWAGHVERLSSNWKAVVGDSDLVIVAGDISWAMHLRDAYADLKWLAGLPGTKLLIRGNHDYWWSSIGKVRAALPPVIYALQNDHFYWNNWAICGTRGWICPDEEGFDHEQDQKIYNREILRLRLSLKSAAGRSEIPIIAALHYPPFNRRHQPSAFTELLEEYQVSICLYGHIHDDGRDYVFQGLRNGVTYHYVAADALDFRPKLLAC